MSKLLSVLFVALIAGAGMWFYLTRQQPQTERVNLTQIADSAGAKMDLASIARAETAYFAEHGSYASLDELVSSSPLGVRTERKGYVYSIEINPGGFTAIARCQTIAGQTCQSYAADQTMEVHPME
jgi:hypothetical protein